MQLISKLLSLLEPRISQPSSGGDDIKAVVRMEWGEVIYLQRLAQCHRQHRGHAWRVPGPDRRRQPHVEKLTQSLQPHSDGSD